MRKLFACVVSDDSFNDFSNEERMQITIFYQNLESFLLMLECEFMLGDCEMLQLND
jgi:hypothetical protein